MGVPRVKDGPNQITKRVPEPAPAGDGATDREAAERLAERRSQFLAIVSHELRAPLTSIVSFSELLRGEEARLSPDGRRFLDIIERNADRLLWLVGDLAMLDRIEAGELPLELAPVDILGVAAEAVRNAAPGAATQGITIHLDADEGPPVNGDYRRLLQVLDNLIGNAVKFSHLDGQVWVAAACDGGTWQIDVSDGGIGIPAEDAARLFGPFVRASNARTAGLPGTGLGLSIVKALVEMHRGHVEVDSVLDEGSTFTVFLPVASASTVAVPYQGPGPRLAHAVGVWKNGRDVAAMR